MRKEDVLKALLVRYVDPQSGEQDWHLLAALFYTLTRLLLPAQRVEQLYYSYLRTYGSRAAMETSLTEAGRQFMRSLQHQQQRDQQRRANAIPLSRRHDKSAPRAAGKETDGTPIDALVGSRAIATLLSGAKAHPAEDDGLRDGSAPFPSATLSLAPIPSSAGGCMANLFVSSPKKSSGGAAHAERSHNHNNTNTNNSNSNSKGYINGDAAVLGESSMVHQLTPAQQRRWRQLRQDPTNPEVLLALLQRFTLVEDAAVFLAPVHPSTVMEFNGIRSGPYDTVVMCPLSLMGIKRRILAARRDYELRKRQIHTPTSALTPTSTPFALAGVGEGSANPRKRGRSASNVASSANATSEAESVADVSTHRVGAVSPTTPTKTNSNSNSSMSAAAVEESGVGVIRTLQDLEQAVWQITANCVFFNAPESYYPFTARRFATACVEIIEQYCMQRVMAT